MSGKPGVMGWTPSLLNCFEKLEQLEHMHSGKKTTITHTIDSYWIPSQNKTKSKLQIWKKCQIFKFLEFCKKNKANLRDLIAATGLAILLKLDSNRLFFSRETPNLGQNRQYFEPCDLEIWWMTFKNNRAPLLCYFKLCAAFCSHWWIQTGVTVRKHLI